ncbi:MAG: hypothetical protein IT365_16915 [Candidatus Hydrogenedentes bacterium]|nr:hypothetical protein [Candidatus Hydrogenedentota bacterium]
MNDLLLAFEGGGTKTRMLLADVAGRVLAAETGGSSSALYIQPRDYARSTRVRLKRLRQAARRAGGQVRLVGLAAPMNASLVESLIREVFGKVTFVHTCEAEIALALFDLRWGVSLVAGTGSSCRYLSRTGARVVCGGLGPQFGDEGSGYWIGKEAIAAAMRAEKGQGSHTSLLERLCAFYAVPDMWSILNLCDRSGHVPGPRVAASVPVVIEAAREGDSVARELFRRAGKALAELVLDTVSRARAARRPIPLVMTGGVFRAGQLVTGPLKRTLRRGPVVFEYYPEAAEPALGIIRVLMRTQQEGR